MGYAKGNLTRGHKIILALVLALPLLVTLGKWSFMPTSEYLNRVVSLGDLGTWSQHMENRLLYILTVPMGAIFVVFVRLTLGIRLLGPFRSILLALSFGITGIVMGIVFMTIVIATVACIRPALKAIQLPYFARMSIILSVVAVFLIAAVLLSDAMEVKQLKNVAFFPIFVLSLVADAFSRILTQEGWGSALWRTSMTVMVGILLTWLFMIPGVKQLLLRYPETLITQIGIIVLIAEYLDLRLLQRLNPGVDVDSEGYVGDIDREMANGGDRADTAS
jgi:hypothetical protein